MDYHILYLVSILGLGMAGQWLAWRLRLPAILVLLIFGFAFGYVWTMIPDGHAAQPDELLGRDLFFAGVSLAVGVILFEGGMSLRFAELRETGRAVLGRSAWESSSLGRSPARRQFCCSGCIQACRSWSGRSWSSAAQR